MDGQVDLSTFTEAKLARPQIADLIGRTQMEVDDRVRHSGEFASVVSFTLDDGSRREKLVELAMGKPQRWFSHERLRQKFMECGAGILPPERLDAAVAAGAGPDRAPHHQPLR